MPKPVYRRHRNCLRGGRCLAGRVCLAVARQGGVHEQSRLRQGPLRRRGVLRHGVRPAVRSVQPHGARRHLFAGHGPADSWGWFGILRQDCAGAGTACYGTCRAACATAAATTPIAPRRAARLPRCVNDSVKLSDTCDGTGGSAKPAIRRTAASTPATRRASSASRRARRHLQCAPAPMRATPRVVSARAIRRRPRASGGGRSKDVAGTVTSCNGFACIAGACQQKCGGPADCDGASGYTCNAAHRCAPAAAPGEDAGKAGTGGTSAGGSPGTSAAAARERAPSWTREWRIPARATRKARLRRMTRAAAAAEPLAAVPRTLLL